MRRPSYFLLFQTRPDAYDSRGVRVFFAVYFGAFLLGGLLGPLVHGLVQVLAEGRAADGGLLAYLSGKSLIVYIDRVRLFAAAISLLWLIQYCQLWGRFGFHWRDGGFRQGLRWGFVGAASLCTVVLLQTLIQDVSPVEPLTVQGVAEVLLRALAGALVLSFLEEALFRGMLLRLFFTAFRPWTAIFLSAFVFAAVHFKRVPYDPALTEVWWGGFAIAGKMAFAFIFESEALPFLNLFLVGLVLNLVFLLTRSLIACVGLHAGWVVVRNTYGKLAESGDSGLFLGSTILVDGLLCAFILLAFAVFLSYALLFRSYKAPPEHNLGGIS
ncbi:MAG: CPBP family intramembrane metalloprotease [Opitutales bacterium]|nr:CPBP family intramembrane metalloprotease [Opitutales bacterium]